jgi:hypothetical protein
VNVRRSRWPVLLAGGVVLAAAVLVAGLVLLRPTSSATIGEVRVECDGIGSAAACERWAADLLAAGPGIRTFDPEDLASLRLSRPFPLPGACAVDYYIGREAEPAARETVDCPAG